MDLIRSWKDPEYRASLSKEQRGLLPAHPAGLVELDDQVLASIAAAGTEHIGTAGCCGGFTRENCGTSPAACDVTRSQYTCSGPACK